MTEPSDESPQPSTLTPEPTLAHRIVALLEVLICSDYPTQLAVAATFSAFGRGPYGARGQLSVAWVVGVSVADTVLLVALILLFLYSHGERPRDIFVGTRQIAGEALAGVRLIFVSFVIGMAVLVAIQLLAPSLHTVEKNPMQALLGSPRDALLFALVVLVAGGIREELQRAFLLHRFEVWLGGGGLGLIVTSAAFGAGHKLQGVDAVIATGTLGAFWGFVYLRRRSAIAPMVSHAGFDLLQIVQFMVVGSLR